MREATAERREFLRHHFGVDPYDPTLYDLTVNTDTLGIDTSVSLVVDALRRADREVGIALAGAVANGERDPGARSALAHWSLAFGEVRHTRLRPVRHAFRYRR